MYSLLLLFGNQSDNLRVISISSFSTRNSRGKCGQMNLLKALKKPQAATQKEPVEYVQTERMFPMVTTLNCRF